MQTHTRVVLVNTGHTPYFNILSNYGNRFQLICRYFDFSDIIADTDTYPLCKMWPVLDILIEKTQNKLPHIPKNELSLDEVMLVWLGCLHFWIDGCQTKLQSRD
jgi:hypothetical protein